jgi:MYXO-CTERM domain-containing protein
MLRRGRLAAALSVVVLSTATAHATAPRSIDADGLVAMVPIKRGLRTHITIDHTVRRTAAWNRFVTAAGGRWSATWDHATAVPSRIWGEGIYAPGSSTDPAVAEAAARAVIEAHLDLLAPGTDAADLVLVANHWDGEMRTLGFTQHAAGVRVVGGQVSVRIKNDRIFVLSSQALPDVAPRRLAAKRVPADELAAGARGELARVVTLPATATVSAPGDEVILPLVGDDGVLAYRTVRPIVIDAGAEGRWTTYADPATGALVARKQELVFVSAATIRYDVVERWSGGSRTTRPAGGANLTVDGLAMTASPTGQIIWNSDAPATVVTSVTGSTVVVVDQASGVLASGTIQATPSGSGTWSVAGDEHADAQVNAFIHAGIVRDFARTRFAFALPFLDERIVANVNIEDECNAFWNGSSINFFRSSADCDNTARLADVIYHEYGHGVHQNALIDGVGAYDGALGEGQADFLAASITGDSGMGRGFFRTNEPLRELDPPDGEARWPDDIGEIHTTGIIFGGTFWDLRKRLITELGQDAGVALSLKLYFAAIQRSTDIPSSLIEALAADDNDGNLANGTPHECSIRDVFGLHGLRTISGRVDAPGAVVATEGQTAAPVQIRISGLSTNCSGDEIDRVSVGWRPGVGGTPVAGAIDAVASGEGYAAEVPLPDDGGRVDFQAQVTFADGNRETLPDNPGDGYYQMYQGETVPLYCTDFETDPFAEGWSISSGSAVDFEWGPANSDHSGTDPDTAHSGENIVGLGIGYDYADQGSAAVHLPPIDVHQYSDVLLQYRRWLNVEDGFYDHAIIQTNGETAWANYNSEQGTSSSTHTLDREWRFQSIPLSARFPGPILNLTFRLDSDQGLHFGGWSMDDLCIVANPSSICGDGVRSATEECDEGDANANAPDACRTNCRIAACGDGVLDTGEECEPGQDPACLPACILDEVDGGCCSAGGASPGGLLLAGGVGLILFRRRRRTR